MRSIITGVDFTKSSYNAAAYAAMLARKTKTKLILFNMFDVPMIHSNSGLYFMSYNSIKDNSLDRLNELARSLQREFKDVKIECFSATGSFKNELKNFIKKKNVYFVVIGMSVKNRFHKYLYGSHATDVAGKLDAPVIIVPEKYKKHRLHDILLAVDSNEKLHQSSLKDLNGLVKDLKLGLTPLHVRTEDDIFETKGKTDLKFDKKKYPVVVIEEKNLERGIRKHLLHKPSDLVAIISRRHSAFYNLFNETHTSTLAFVSKVPVMAIHE